MRENRESTEGYSRTEKTPQFGKSGLNIWSRRDKLRNKNAIGRRGNREEDEKTKNSYAVT